MSPKTTANELHASDIMTREPVTVERSTTARELARILMDNEISGVPVIDDQYRVLGVVSRTDLLQRFVEGPPGSVPSTFFERMAEGLDFDTDVDPEQLGVVEDFMSPEPVTALPTDPISKVAHQMADEHVHRVIIVDEQEHLLGIVTSLDVLGAFPQ